MKKNNKNNNNYYYSLVLQLVFVLLFSIPLAQAVSISESISSSYSPSTSNTASFSVSNTGSYTNSPSFSISSSYSVSTSYSPSTSYSTSVSVTSSYSPSYSVTVTGSNSITISISISPSKLLGVAAKDFSETNSISPPPVGAPPFSPRNIQLKNCGNGVKDKNEKCERYLNPMNRCCTARCQFAKGGLKCRLNVGKKVCYKPPRCSGFGTCRQNKKRPNFSPCSGGACFNGQCKAGLRSINRRKLKKLKRRLNRDLNQIEEDDEDEDEEDDGDYSLEEAYLESLKVFNKQAQEENEREEREYLEMLRQEQLDL
jgi:hypothetical protein